MDDNNNMHKRRMVAVRLSDQLLEEKHSMTKSETIAVTIEELEKCLGINTTRDSDRYLPKSKLDEWNE